mgnify:CR=1 FL=1
MKKQILAICTMVLFTLVLVTGILPAMAEQENESLLISDCSTLDGWVKTGGNALTVNPNGWTSVGAIGCDINSGAFRTATYTIPQAKDVSGYTHLEWDMLFTPGMWAQIAEHYADNVFLKIGSSTGDTRTYKLDKITAVAYQGNDYWHHFSVTLSDYTSTAGNFNPSALNTFIFVTTEGAPSTSVMNGQLRFDNIYATKEAVSTTDPTTNTTESVTITTTSSSADQSINKANPSGALWLSDCDQADGWTSRDADSNNVAVTVDTALKTEGAASVGVTAQGGVLKEIVYKPVSALNVSSYKYIEFDMYFSDLTWFNDCGGVMIEMTSSGTCDQQSNRIAQKGFMNKNSEFASDAAAGGASGKWYHFKFELATPQSQVNGGCDLTKVNYFRFYSVQPQATTPDYTMRIDNIVFSTDAYGDEGGSENITSGTTSDGDSGATTGTNPSDNSPATGVPFAIAPVAVAFSSALGLKALRKHKNRT